VYTDPPIATDAGLPNLIDAYGGSGQAPNGPRGWRADLDGDGDVDGSDYLLFADAYNGVGNPPRPPSPTVSVGSMGLTTGPMVVSRVGNSFFFTGRRLDVIDKQDASTPHHFTDDYAGLQLYDYRARTMDPVLGRFGQRDPLEGGEEYLYGPNPYEYVLSRPAQLVDPAGLSPAGQPTAPVPVIPPGSEIEVVLKMDNVFGDRRPCGWIVMTGLSNLQPKLSWKDLEVSSPFTGCGPFKNLTNIFIKSITDKINKGRPVGQELPCPPPLVCCNRRGFNGTYSVTITLQPLQLKNLFNKPVCEVQGQITATATLQGELGGCFNK